MTTSRRTQVLWLIGGLVILFYTLTPIAWMISLSLKPGGDIFNKQFLPSNWSLDNYAIARLDFPGKKLILSVALAIAMFPVISLVGPLFDMWRAIGLFDTWLGLIIPYISFSLPLSIWTLSAFFREIPWEMEQAAQVDGATQWQAFRRVIVPLAAPGVFTTAIIAFFAGWNDFVFGVSLTSTDAARPVPAALAFFTGASQFQQPTAAIAAASVVVTIPIVIVTLLFQRRIVAGLTSGAVKG
jgi:multiple sugar transport system permease protein